MLTRDQILHIVGESWWENNNILMDFIHHHLNREGAKIFTKEHCAFAEAADPDEGGHGEETIRILCEYAKTVEQERAVLATLRQSLSVFRYQYDQIGKAAIGVSKKLS